jgi:hypothetical protein
MSCLPRGGPRRGRSEVNIRAGGRLRRASRELEKWTREIIEPEWPPVECPACHEGQLRLSDWKDIRTRESSKSASWHGHEAWDPDWIAGVFDAPLACNVCAEPALAVGRWTVSYGNTYEQQYVDRLRVNYVEPPLPLIALPSGTPDAVAAHVEEAGRVVFADPPSAAAAVRKAVEALLDAQGVRRKRRVKSGTSFRLKRESLDARLDALENSQPDVAHLLRAVKWLGNSGAHESSLAVADVLDGAELLAVGLELLYDNSHDAAKRLAADITKRKGRPR